MHRMNQSLMVRRDVVRAGKACIELVNGECVSILDSLQPRSVSVIMTSPPYNLGVKYEAYDDSISREDYLDWTARWTAAARRVLEPDGSLFLNMGCKPSSQLGPEQVVLRAVESSGFVVQNKLYWVKSVSVRVKTKPELIKEAAAKAMPGLSDTQLRSLVKAFEEVEGEDGLERTFGHMKPLNSPRFVNDCVEMVYHLTRDGETPLDRLAVGSPFEDKSNLTRGTRGKNGDRRCRGNAIHIPYETIQSRDDDRPHPATFPIGLASYCYRLHGIERIKMTMDPFSGLGNSAIAAARLGLSHVGIELASQTHADALKRLVDEVALINGGRA